MKKVFTELLILCAARPLILLLLAWMNFMVLIKIQKNPDEYGIGIYYLARSSQYLFLKDEYLVPPGLRNLYIFSGGKKSDGRSGFILRLAISAFAV